MTTQNKQEAPSSESDIQERSFIVNLYKALTSEKESFSKAFNDYHLVRRRYIVSRTSTHYGKDKHEPAPLLNRTLIDIGCGSSKLAEEMTFRGADVTAIDTNTQVIESAREQAKHDGALVNFIAGNTEDILKSGEKYDIVMCMDLFEYADHTSKLLWTVHQILKDDGIMLFSCNNRTWKSAFWHMLIAQTLGKWVSKGTYRFKRFRSAEPFKAKIEANGFNVEEIKGVTFDLQKMKWQRTAKADIRYLGYATKKK